MEMDKRAERGDRQGKEGRTGRTSVVREDFVRRKEEESDEVFRDEWDFKLTDAIDFLLDAEEGILSNRRERVRIEGRTESRHDEG